MNSCISRKNMVPGMKLMTVFFYTVSIMLILMVASVCRNTVDARPESLPATDDTVTIDRVYFDIRSIESVVIDKIVVDTLIMDAVVRVADTLTFDSISFDIRSVNRVEIDTVTVDTLIIDPARPGIRDFDRVIPDEPVVDVTPSEIPQFEDIQFEVSIRDRELYLISNGERVSAYPVAVGQPDWPTRPGSWRIYEVVWNPWWHPPDEEWAWNYAIMAPGDPDNPLGRAQLIYDAPRSIHGTINPSSIGEAVSHGSIRMNNDEIMKLARMVMEYAGVDRDEEWYETVQNEPNRNVRIRLDKPVPIRVY